MKHLFTFIICLVFFILWAGWLSAQPLSGSTVAGGVRVGSSPEALNTPFGVALDAAGYIYVADQANGRIQKFAPNSTAGSSATTVVSGLNAPYGITLDKVGNIYVSDTYNKRVQKYPSNSTAGNSGTTVAIVSDPTDAYVDNNGFLYVADQLSAQILKYPPNSTANTTGTVVAKNGLSRAVRLVLDQEGNIYVTDTDRNRVLKYPSNSTASTVPTVVANLGLTDPIGLDLDRLGNIYVTSSSAQILRYPANSTASTPGTLIVGDIVTGGESSRLNEPRNIFIDRAGYIYVADSKNHRIQKYALASITTQPDASSSICPGSSVSNSIKVAGIGPFAYQWYKNDLNTPLSNQNTATLTLSDVKESSTGRYFVVVTTVGFSVASQSLNLNVNPRPTASVSGGSSVCEGATRPDVLIALTGSRPWAITYSNGTTSQNVSNIITSPYVISQAPAGIYTVSSVSDVNCQGIGIGSANVTVNPLPVAYSVTGGGVYCSGGNGVAVGLANSQTGVSYQLLINGTPTGTAMAGTTGNAISFGNQTLNGTYTVRATNPNANCQQTMTGSVSITVNVLPIAYQVTGGGSFCQGKAGVAVGLSDAQAGVLYILRRGELNVASVLASQSGTINFGTFNQVGSYTVLARNNATGCEQLQTGSANITVNDNPNAGLGNDGAITCLKFNSQLTASGGDNGATYRIVGPNNFLQSGTGTGASVSTGGVYSLTVTNTTGCSATTSNTVEENKTPPQAVQLNNGGELTCVKTSTSLTPGSSTDGATFALSGPSLNSSNATGPGQYTVTATNPVNGCTAKATTDVAQNIAPPTGVSLSSSGTLSANNPTVTLTASSNATAGVGVSYEFSQPARKINDTQARVTNSGTYSVAATRSDNGCTATATTNVLGAASVTACRGASATIDLVAMGSPVRYEWYVGVATGQPLRDGSFYQGAATANLKVFSVTQSQVYYTRVFYADGSSAVYGPYRVTLNTNCGAREVADVDSPIQKPGSELRITLLGNPVQGEELKALVQGAVGQRLYVELVDQSGRSVRQQVFESADSQQLINWNLNSSCSGLYLLQAVSGQQRHTAKVLKP